MKKLTFVAAMAIAAATFTSCGNGTPKANLKSDVDSMSYAIGLSQTQGLKEYLVDRLQIDTAYMNDFIKGLNDGANAGDDKKKAAYYAGIQIGQQISTQMMPGINKELFGAEGTKSISLDQFMAGFVSGVTGKDGLMSVEDAQTMAKSLMDQVKNDALLEQYGDNKKAGEDFLAAQKKLAKKKKSGITVLPSGLMYKVLVKGDGPVAKESDKVKVKYEGRLIDGTVFDSTEKHGGEPATFSPGQVIKGWTEALTLMPVGSKWQLYIPQELAYGSREAGQIKPFSALIFDVEVLGIEEPKKEEKK